MQPPSCPAQGWVVRGGTRVSTPLNRTNPLSPPAFLPTGLEQAEDSPQQQAGCFRSPGSQGGSHASSITPPHTHTLRPANQARNLIRARIGHEAFALFLKPGVPIALLTPQHNSPSASTGGGALCQRCKLAGSNQCPSTLPASLPGTITAAGADSPGATNIRPPLIHPRLPVRPACPLLRAPTIRCSVARYSNL